MIFGAQNAMDGCRKGIIDETLGQWGFRVFNDGCEDVESDFLQSVVRVFALYVQNADQSWDNFQLQRMQTEWILAKDLQDVLDVLQEIWVVVVF